MTFLVAEGANGVSGLAYWFGYNCSDEELSAEKLGFVFFLGGSTSNSQDAGFFPWNFQTSVDKRGGWWTWWRANEAGQRNGANVLERGIGAARGCRESCSWSPLLWYSKWLGCFSTVRGEGDGGKCLEGCGCCPFGDGRVAAGALCAPASPPVPVGKGFSSLKISSCCLESAPGSVVWYVIWTWLQGPCNLSWSRLPCAPGDQAVGKAGLCCAPDWVQVHSRLPYVMAHYPVLTPLSLLCIKLLKPIYLATAETWHWRGWAREGRDLLFPRMNLNCKSWMFAPEPFGKAAGVLGCCCCEWGQLGNYFLDLIFLAWICSAWPENHKEFFLVGCLCLLDGTFRGPKF